jgi:predicted acylesterase/phospholipase RssA
MGKLTADAHFGKTFCRVLVVAMCFAMAACVGRPQEAPATRTLQPMEAVDASVDANRVFSGRTTADDGVHTVLALSAGGADGAFGAGVLTGWTKNGSRPEFDVVTGVSTGALMAVLAFLGPEYDNVLEQFYTTTTNNEVYRQSSSGLLGPSLYDNEPLKLRIEEFITQDILDRVAAQHAKGRRLYIATTNLDAGDLVIWDMGEIANGGRTDNVLHFQKVLRASAAVPAFFPPVYIKPQRGIQLRQAHVDGGVKAPVLLKGFMLPKNQPKQVFLIVNGNTTRLNSNTPVQNKVLDIAKKSIVEMMREQQDDTIYRAYVQARNSGADFHMTQIPDSIPLTEEGLNFSVERMRRLFLAGQEIGKRGPGKWLSAPPKLDEYEQVARR